MPPFTTQSPCALSITEITGRKEALQQKTRDAGA